MKSVYLNKKFIVGMVDRAIASFAQGALAILTAGATGLLDLDFALMVSVAGLVALTSVAMSFYEPRRIINAEEEHESTLTQKIEKIIEKNEQKIIDEIANPIKNPFVEEKK